MAHEYDLVVLGGGTGGYVAALKASRLGKRVAIVERSKLGGTCLHRGCIPSKSLLRSAEVYRTVKEALQFGISVGSSHVEWKQVQSRKNQVVEQLHKGVQHLIKKGKIDVYYGHGRILGPSIFSPLCGTISVEGEEGTEPVMLLPKFVLIATGSRPRMIEGLAYDGVHVITSDEALQLSQLPRSVVIVGGGVIGVEWASIFVDLGCEVALIEGSDRILPLEDHEISREMTRLLKKRGVSIVTSARIDPATLQVENGVTIKGEANGKEFVAKGEKLLLSVGRQGNVEEIGLQNTEVVHENGRISVNEFYQTKEMHIYAIGDVSSRLQLAHVATAEASVAVDHMFGEFTRPIQYDYIPRAIYSYPEAASVGITETEAKKRGHNVTIGKISFKSIGKALITGNGDGFVKVVKDADTDDLLGVHMIGAHVTDLISEAALAHVLEATPWEISQVIHPHPSLSEGLFEAVLAVEGTPLHV